MDTSNFIHYGYIKQIFKNHSQPSKKEGRLGISMVSSYFSSSTFTKNEIGGMLKEMET